MNALDEVTEAGIYAKLVPPPSNKIEAHILILPWYIARAYLSLTTLLASTADVMFSQMHNILPKVRRRCFNLTTSFACPRLAASVEDVVNCFLPVLG